MTLIPCPACGKEVSAISSNCIGCGHPLAAVTIEQTGKKWKQAKLLAGGFLVAALLAAFAGFPALALPFFIATVCTAIYAGAGAWWYHS